MALNSVNTSSFDQIYCDISEIKSENQEIFKKPVFIGPRRGTKGLPKINASNHKISEQDGQVVRANELPAILELKPEPISKFQSLPYSEPNWRGLPSDDYFLEELKSGVIQRSISLRQKSFIVFGRIDVCDIVMAHPTISRYHAILQYRGVPDGVFDKGFYLYDLESTHGSFLNKAKIKPKAYVRLKVGHIIKFGCSTRFFLLQGPDHDREEESELSLTEIKEKRKLEIVEKARKEEEEEIKQKKEEEEREKLIEDRGISWGLGEDADEEEDLSENPYAVTTNEELYSDEPKKALRHWFEREGEELHFLTEQAEKGKIACKIVLPLDDGGGKEIVVETSARSKRDAQTECALEACRIIDKLGLFRQSKQEAKRYQKRNWEENDYYDSDEDSFFDRTGDLDIKRQRRMKKAGKIQATVETYESLMTKHTHVMQCLNESQIKLQKLLELDQIKIESENEELDALDTFMNALKHDKPAKLDIKIAKDEVAKLEKEENHLRKLINIAKPTSLPELKPLTVMPASSTKVIGKSPCIKKSEIVAFKPTERKKPNLDLADADSIETEKIRVFGPTIPQGKQSLQQGNFQKMKKKVKPRLSEKADKNIPEVIVDPEEEYVNLVWQPPKGQTGDGRTSLNEKFGY